MTNKNVLERLNTEILRTITEGNFNTWITSRDTVKYTNSAKGSVVVKFVVNEALEEEEHRGSQPSREWYNTTTTALFRAIS